MFLKKRRLQTLERDFSPSQFLLTRSWLCCHLSHEECAELVRYMEPMTVFPQDIIAAEGGKNVKIFFLQRGAASVVHHGSILASLPPGSTFGECSSFFGETLRSALVALSQCDLWTLPIQALHKVLAGSPQARLLIQRKASARRTRWLAERKSAAVSAVSRSLGKVSVFAHCTELMRQKIAEAARPRVFFPAATKT